MSKVVVVEDNLTNRELIGEILSLWGHEVMEAGDGPEALEQMAEIRPDVVLLDIQLPGLDGYEVLKRIREVPSLNGLKVVALTAYAMQRDRERVDTAGFDGYVTKPIDLDKLQEAIATRSGGRRA